MKNVVMEAFNKIFAGAAGLLAKSGHLKITVAAKIMTGIALVAVVSEAFAFLIESNDPEFSAIEELEPEENLERKAEQNKITEVIE